MPIQIHPQPIHDPNAQQRQNTSIDKGGPYTSDHKIIRDQKVRLPHNGNQPSPYLIHRLQKKSHNNKVDRNQSQKQKPPVSGQRSIYLHITQPFPSPSVPSP